MILSGPRPYPLTRREWVIYRRHHAALHTLACGHPYDFWDVLAGILTAVYRRRRRERGLA